MAFLCECAHGSTSISLFQFTNEKFEWHIPFPDHPIVIQIALPYLYARVSNVVDNYPISVPTNTALGIKVYPLESISLLDIQFRIWLSTYNVLYVGRIQPVCLFPKSYDRDG